MRKTIDIRERIAVRAYFAWLNGSTAGAETDWLEAERIEQAYGERRAAAAKKAAQTRKAKGTKAPAEMLVAAVHHGAGRRPAAH